MKSMIQINFTIRIRICIGTERIVHTYSVYTVERPITNSLEPFVVSNGLVQILTQLEVKSVGTFTSLRLLLLHTPEK